jgi:hypothetical protein
MAFSFTDAGRGFTDAGGDPARTSGSITYETP